MITHDEAKDSLMDLDLKVSDEVFTPEFDILIQYITQQEQFAKDVARFLELDSMMYLQGWHSKEETEEYQELRYKLAKVGKEE